MVLSNSAFEENQRVPVIAGMAPKYPNLDSQSTNDELLEEISYNAVAAVITQ